MVLAVAVGLLVRHFTGFEPAVVLGLAVGLILAPLVPAKTACGVRLSLPDSAQVSRDDPSAGSAVRDIEERS